MWLTLARLAADGRTSSSSSPHEELGVLSDAAARAFDSMLQEVKVKVKV
jgi:hypothetical protein